MNIIKKYDFGIRKPSANCLAYVKDDIWQRFLDKWVYFYIDGECVFCKHIFKEERIYQIIYSGSDINGDGVYIIYKADILSLGKDINVMPDIYDLVLGSFEEEDYLKKLLDEDFITSEEFEMFKTQKSDTIAKQWELRQIPRELL